MLISTGGFAVLMLYLICLSSSPYLLASSIIITFITVYILIKKRYHTPWMAYSLILTVILFHNFHGLTLSAEQKNTSEEAIQWLKNNSEKSDVLMLPSIMPQNQFLPMTSYNFALVSRPTILGIKEAQVFAYVASLFPQVRHELEIFYDVRAQSGVRRFQKYAWAVAMDAVPMAGIARAKAEYPRLAYVMRQKKYPLPLPEAFSNSEYVIYSLKN